MAPPPMQIPGYYYDEEKRKYFKMEKGATAPSSAAWSDRNVKKRKADEAEAAATKRAADVAATRVRRAPALADPVFGGLLRRELDGGRDAGDAPQIAWARGLQDKGAVRFPGRVESFVTIAEERLGMGLFYAICANTPRDGPHLPGHSLPVYSNYFYRDQYDHIQTGPAVNPALSRFCSRYTESCFMLSDLSGMAWDPAGESVILTSSSATASDIMVRKCSLHRHADPQGKPTWSLGFPRGFADHIGRIPPVWACAVAPAASKTPYLALGTHRGVYIMDVRNDSGRSIMTNISAPRRLRGSPPPSAMPSGEVFALDFVADHPQILMAGGRGPAGICVTDLREERRSPPAMEAVDDGRINSGAGRRRGVSARATITNINNSRRRKLLWRDGSSLKASSQADEQSGDESQSVLLCHPGHHDARYRGIVFPEGATSTLSSGHRDHSVRWLQVAQEPVVNHVVSLNQYHVLSAGIEGRMHVWDLRRGQGRPYTSFPAYRNKATVRGLGLAVEKALGIVAAANDDGSVVLHSLRSGEPLPAASSPALYRLTRPPTPTPPCPRLQWACLPGDNSPSLFVASGPEVRKFSFGVESGLRGDEFSVEA